MNTLLAIVNEPKDSKSFINYAAHLAKDLKVDLHLLNVQNPNLYPLGTPGSLGAETSQMQEKMEGLAETADNILAEMVEKADPKVLKSTAISHSSEIGTIELVIDEYLKQKKAHMIVLRGNDRKNFWVQDSSNMDIIRDFDCPIWIIPKETAYHPFKEVVYATDYHEEDIPTLKEVLNITNPFKPHITALHATESIDFEEKIKSSGFSQMVQEKTGYNNISITNLSEKGNGNIAHLINDYALHVDADLVVVLKENRNFLERIFSSSSTKKIIKESQLPVLVYHKNS